MELDHFRSGRDVDVARRPIDATPWRRRFPDAEFVDHFAGRVRPSDLAAGVDIEVAVRGICVEPLPGAKLQRGPSRLGVAVEFGGAVGLE